MDENLYIVRQLNADTYEVTNFGDYSIPLSVYKVKITKHSISCSCPGFYRQKDKSEHKHTRIVDFWLKNLDGKAGYAFWFDGEDLEYRKFLDDPEIFEDKLVLKLQPLAI